MIKPQKTLLPKKLQMITLKLKSFAFMKIFMKESSSPMRQHKVRHYDLQLEGATAISSWLKNKLQQVFFRSFYKLKQWKKLTQSPSSSTLIQPHSYPYISVINSQANSPSKKVPQRTRCQTDRESYVKSKQTQQQNNLRKNCRSQFGQQTQLSQNSKKSNLQSLLQKVKQVNSQSKIEKENEQHKANNYQIYDDSYIGSRVLSTGTGRFDRYRKSSGQTKNVNFKQHVNIPLNTCHPSDRHYNQGDRQQSTYISYQPGQNYMKQFQTPNSHIQRMQQDGVMDKNNLMSLKKWHRNQKRSVIMSKINELQNSLVAEYSRPAEDFYQDYREDDFYPINNNDHNYDPKYDAYQMPNNYSQDYLQQRARQAPRSVHQVKMRKY